MTHRATPSATPPPDALRPVAPLWAFGLEGGWLSRHLAAGLEAATGDAPRLAGIRDALAAWNVERQPLYPAFAAAALAAGRRLGDPPARRAMCAALARPVAPRPADAAWPALRDGPDPDAAQAFLAAALADPAAAPAWRGRAFDFALAKGRGQLARAVAASLAADASLAPVAPRILAEAALAWDGPAAGLTALADLDRERFPRFHALAASHCLAETGRRDEATAILADLWRGQSWHPGLTLRLHALARPLPPADLDALPGRLFVFLYTCNRAALLEATLDSLAAARLGPAVVTVLDNGGHDDTPAVCRRAADRFGPGRFRVLRLPVNIGAPAARNWLAAAHGPGPEDLAAYVDDDVRLPPDWLEVLAGALAADPAADAAGARIVAAAPGAARLVQSADVRLLAPDAAHAVRPLINHGPGPDLGLLATVRPCASVSGCCHLLRGRAIAGGAPFDIRFSPSQFDDLARDLHGFLAGRRAVYAGVCAVAHHQHAGPAQARDRAAVGQLAGARAKLDGLFDPARMAVVARRDLDTAWEELSDKWRDLRETRLPGT